MADEGKEGMAGLCPSEGHAGAAIVCIVEDIGGFKQESDVDYFFFLRLFWTSTSGKMKQIYFSLFFPLSTI